MKATRLKGKISLLLVPCQASPAKLPSGCTHLSLHERIISLGCVQFRKLQYNSVSCFLCSLCRGASTRILCPALAGEATTRALRAATRCYALPAEDRAPSAACHKTGDSAWSPLRVITSPAPPRGQLTATICIPRRSANQSRAGAAGATRGDWRATLNPIGTAS